MSGSAPGATGAPDGGSGAEEYRRYIGVAERRVRPAVGQRPAVAARAGGPEEAAASPAAPHGTDSASVHLAVGARGQGAIATEAARLRSWPSPTRVTPRFRTPPEKGSASS
ncbi:hypothetical protein QFZ75_005537 [Streptomyces sp. V3I8]|uniref:hypothetical protein n=1 Tax=Streptomyces sp. V3I8 TaxID=3042279 RepID=UPI00278939D6|nr:hypothetical protein [Streptomyces sp. V3I8]